MLQPRDVLLVTTPGTGEGAQGTWLWSISSLFQFSYLSPLLPPETIHRCLFAAFSIPVTIPLHMAERLHCTSFPSSLAQSRGFFTQCDFQKNMALAQHPWATTLPAVPSGTWALSVHSKQPFPSVPPSCRTPHVLSHLLHLNYTCNRVLEAYNP